MIPEEVAEIANLLRNEYDEKDEQVYNHSIDVAWQIYNMMKAYDKANLEGSY